MMVESGSSSGGSWYQLQSYGYPAEAWGLGLTVLGLGDLNSVFTDRFIVQTFHWQRENTGNVNQGGLLHTAEAESFARM